jgi:Domain of unknown function (DUF4276)
LKPEHIEFLVEDESTEAALQALLPKIIGEVSFEIYRHLGKQDLLSKLPARLNGYAAWLPGNWRVVVIVDRDDDDCAQLKMRLETAARDAGLLSKSRSTDSEYQVATRIAIEELEAWFFGDWDAVSQAYPRIKPNIPSKDGFRDPDAIAGGTWEALERHLQRAGYYESGLRKIELARSIAQHMEPDRNRSRSFQAFKTVLDEMMA